MYVPFIVLALFFTALTLLLEIFVSYRVYARYLKWLTLSLIMYVITVFVIHVQWGQVITHIIIPRIEWSKEFFLILVGVIGTTISPYLFFWQASEEVEEKIAKGKVLARQRRGTTIHDIKVMRSDVKAGMIFSNIV